jgi:hypothetical protein
MQSIVHNIQCRTLHCNAAKKPDERVAAASLWRALDLRSKNVCQFGRDVLSVMVPRLRMRVNIRTQACLSRRDQMIVARQFIAWNPVQKGIRPVGTV